MVDYKFKILEDFVIKCFNDQLLINYDIDIVYIQGSDDPWIC